MDENSNNYLQINPEDYYAVLDRCSFAERNVLTLAHEVVSEQRWAKHYHDKCIEMRDAVQPVIEFAEMYVLSPHPVEEKIAQLKAILESI